MNGNSGNCSQNTINVSGLEKEQLQSLKVLPSFPAPKQNGQIGLIGSINNSLTVSKMTNYTVSLIGFDGFFIPKLTLGGSWLNGSGMEWAWFSLSEFSLTLTDRTERQHRKWLKSKSKRTLSGQEPA